jgi:hypothetical protein
MSDIFDRGRDAEFELGFAVGKDAFYFVGGSSLCDFGVLSLYDWELSGECLEEAGGDESRI